MDLECPVCFETNDSSQRIWCTFPCDHKTCLNCLLKITKPAKCPMCRYDIESFVPRKSETINPFCEAVVDNAFEFVIQRIQQQETRIVIQNNINSLVPVSQNPSENDGNGED